MDPTNTATFHTTKDDIVIELFGDEAPATVASFVDLAGGTKEYHGPNTGGTKTGEFYDGLDFHRVVGGFVIQGGCPLEAGAGGPGYRFADKFHPELSLNRPYLLTMANVGPGTNDFQFFITAAPTPHLNRRHTVFGGVKDPASQAVVDAITTTETDHRDRPTTLVVINSVTLP